MREGEALIRDVATFLATEPNESDRIMARELYQGLDSILTELAEAQRVRDNHWTYAQGLKERAEKAEAREAWVENVYKFNALNARIQELEAALKRTEALCTHPARTCVALAEDEA